MLFYFHPMSASLFHIGLVQFDIAWEHPQANMIRIEQILADHHRLDLVILPEMWTTGFTMRPDTAAEVHPGPALEWMQTQAARYDTAVAGSIAVKDGGQYYNRWYCVLPEGGITTYDKRHLFSYGREDQHYTPGNVQATLTWRGWKIRPIICYDLRFPVWMRNVDDYDLLVVVANWPQARIHHWDALLKARAIENQCYVAAVNRVGTDGNGLQYNGHSGVFDMNGQGILMCDETEGLKTVAIDRQALTAFREQFRFLQDRDHFRLEPGN